MEKTARYRQPYFKSRDHLVRRDEIFIQKLKKKKKKIRRDRAM